MVFPGQSLWISQPAMLDSQRSSLKSAKVTFLRWKNFHWLRQELLHPFHLKGGAPKQAEGERLVDKKSLLLKV